MDPVPQEDVHQQQRRWVQGEVAHDHTFYLGLVHEEHECFGVRAREQEWQWYESIGGQCAIAYDLLVDIREECKHFFAACQ